jgi:hypothetical protein
MEGETRAGEARRGYPHPKRHAEKPLVSGMCMERSDTAMQRRPVPAGQRAPQQSHRAGRVFGDNTPLLEGEAARASQPWRQA